MFQSNTVARNGFLPALNNLLKSKKGIDYNSAFKFYSLFFSEYKTDLM